VRFLCERDGNLIEVAVYELLVGDSAESMPNTDKPPRRSLAENDLGADSAPALKKAINQADYLPAKEMIHARQSGTPAE
jgi:hypothetical protein